MKKWICFSLLNLFSLLSVEASPSFYDETQRILNLYCIQCHNQNNLKITNGLGFGGFSLENLSLLPKKRDDKILIVPGSSEKSLLYQVLVVEVNNNKNIKAMPLAGQRLNANEIETIKSWIEAGAETPEDQVAAYLQLNFEAEVMPILQKHCISCHNPKSKEVNGGNLDLTTFGGLKQGGHSGSVLVEGKPYQSLLYLATAMRDEERYAMPPADRYARLSLLQISKIRQWIQEGAHWPKGLMIEPITATVDPDSAQANDSEEMKLVKKIHEKIVKNSNETHLAYTEKRTDGVKFEMLPIPAGSFNWQGQAADDLIQVELSAFWMGKYEVSWNEYEPFMLSELPRERNGQLLEFMRDQIEDPLEFVARPTAPYHTMSFGMPKEGHPALSMTLHAANKYCEWLSFQTGHFYRLPTEAEWEYAYGANPKTGTYWEGGATVAKEYAKYGGDLNAHYGPVGNLKPNAFGLHDMAGNVAEWTLDQYIEHRKNFYGSLTKLIDPWIKANKPYPQVVKGGHYRSGLDMVSAKARVPSEPSWKASDPQVPKSVWYLTDYPYIGFRIVRPLKVPSVQAMYRAWNTGVEYDN